MNIQLEYKHLDVQEMCLDSYTILSSSRCNQHLIFPECIWSTYSARYVLHPISPLPIPVYVSLMYISIVNLYGLYDICFYRYYRSYMSYMPYMSLSIFKNSYNLIFIDDKPSLLMKRYLVK